MSLPAYSVVIPVFNGADTIGAALDSVLAQTQPPKSIVVVDDGSTDATADAVRAHAGPVELIQQANAGPGAATNRGFAAVDTDIFATLDADDLWLPRKAERQLRLLADDADLALVVAKMASFHGAPESADLDNARMGWSRTTLMVRSAVFRKVGPVVDPPGGLGDMVDWFARLRAMGFRALALDEVLALRRIRPGSMTYGRTRESTRGYLLAAREALKRRRSQTPSE